MTALHQYSRLEAAGLWRSAPNAQAREVIVGLRKATIVLLDPKSEMPLTQWSLPAVVRLGEGDGLVIYASHADGQETLEIDDHTMIDALDRVRTALERRRKKPGRLRTALLAASVIGVIGGMALWLPFGLYGFTAKRVPDAVRRDIAAMAMRDIATISGSACAGAAGLIAASDLARRVSMVQGSLPEPGKHPQIAVLREGLAATAALPDGTILLPYRVIEQADGPDSLAGIILAARISAQTTDPLLPALRHAGIGAAFHLLSRGTLPNGALDGYGLALADMPANDIDPAQLHAAFVSAQITSAPYAALVADTSLSALPDAAPDGSMPDVLDDAAFLGLQYMCDGQ